ncbi:UPF0488 protein C8orf33 homolog [Pocillopora verrucosa]|uniref:UPF0488 protein C8orf33 homolog n=1 Tax=Pocillopora verrucosa TaxID=203993 RepID=UPI00333F1E9C
MADGEASKELTAKQRKNKKKKEAAKRKKQEQSLKESVEGSKKHDGSETQENFESAEDKFHRELNWCIEQLEMGLAFQKTDKKHAEVVHRHLRSLKSSKTPMPRKRQLMFSLFGDYRKKMEEDRRREKQEPSVNPRLATVNREEQKSIFVKVCQTKCKDSDKEKATDKEEIPSNNVWKFQTSDNEFRFDFGDSRS